MALKHSWDDASKTPQPDHDAMRPPPPDSMRVADGGWEDAPPGGLKAVWPNFWGCVFVVWPAPGARETLPKGGGRSHPCFLIVSRSPGADQTTKIDHLRVNMFFSTNRTRNLATVLIHTRVTCNALARSATILHMCELGGCMCVGSPLKLHLHLFIA